MKAIWNGEVIADSETTVMLEGNHYFPMSSLKKEFFKESDYRSICPWKGQASYFSIEVGGQTNTDAAWYYPEPSDRATQEGIKDHVAFWKGVEMKA